MLLDQGGVGIALRLGRYGGRGDRPAGLGIAAGLARIGGMAGGAGRRARITATPAAAEQELATRRREAGKAWIGGAGLRRIIRQDRSTAGIGSQSDGRREDRKSTRMNSSHECAPRLTSSA